MKFWYNIFIHFLSDSVKKLTAMEADRSTSAKTEDSKKMVDPAEYPAEMEYPIENHRNIVIIGKTGAGKATIANAILGSNKFTVGSSIQSSTRKSNESITCRRLQVGDHYYTIALVDTTEVRDDRQQDHKIQKRINEVLTTFSHFNMIILVFKSEQFTPQEKESFQKVISILKDVSLVAALVVTCCELKDEEEREEIKKKLAMYESATEEVVQFAKKGIFLVGLPKITEIPPALKRFYEQRVESDQQKLQTLAREASTSVKNPFPVEKSEKVVCNLS